jgi:hypothetical protein
MGRLIRAFLIGAALGFLAGLVAPPRAKRASEETAERWDVEGSTTTVRQEQFAQASEK